MEQKTYQNNNLSIAANVWNKSSNTKPTIIALHGWLDNANSFYPLADLISEEYNFIALDLPGHGLSDWQPKGIILHCLQEVKTIVDTINNIFPNKDIILLGHSLGAGYASIAATLLGKNLKALICLDALGPLSLSEDALPSFFEKASYQNNRLYKKPLPSYNSLDEATNARSKSTALSRQHVSMLVDRGIKVVDNKYIWRNDPRLVNNSIYRLSEAQVSAFLESIKVPTLLIEPTDGWPGYNSPPYEHRKKLIDNLTVEVIEGHHHVHMDKADTIKKIILSYMTKIGQR